jgi:hypothetical protein
MSKKINNDAMGQLLEGLTSSAVSPGSESSDSATISESRNNSQEEHKDSSRSVRSKTNGKMRICTSLDKTLMNKIRAISEKEGVQINELITLGLNMVVSKYEAQHGQIRPKKGVRGDINTIFR